jgi:hypothetical protein
MELASQSGWYTSLIKPASNNLPIFFFITSFFVLGEMSESLLDWLGTWVQMEFVLNQFPRDSRHLNRLPCKYVPVFLEEFD